LEVVALAAIQGLNQKLEANEKARDAEIEVLKQNLPKLKTARAIAPRKETTPKDFRWIRYGTNLVVIGLQRRLGPPDNYFEQFATGLRVAECRIEQLCSLPVIISKTDTGNF
jgi:hypothetical protein